MIPDSNNSGEQPPKANEAAYDDHDNLYLFGTI